MNLQEHTSGSAKSVGMVICFSSIGWDGEVLSDALFWLEVESQSSNTCWMSLSAVENMWPQASIQKLNPNSHTCSKYEKVHFVINLSALYHWNPWLKTNKPYTSTTSFLSWKKYPTLLNIIYFFYNIYNTVLVFLPNRKQNSAERFSRDEYQLIFSILTHWHKGLPKCSNWAWSLLLKQLRLLNRMMHLHQIWCIYV